jgi:glycine dehydrogenase subunit 1
MSALGPEGFRELGETVIQRAHYAAKLLAGINGITIKRRTGFFKEFVVNFDGTGKTAAQVNAALLKRNIFGGLDLSRQFPELGNSALYCVTEVHAVEDLQRLAQNLAEVCAR